MAGLEALGGGNLTAQVAAAVDAEIAALAADAEALKGLLDIGSTARATVLKSNGLTDLLQIVGKRVAASLPPDLKPGDQIFVEVTGFTDGHINLRVVPAPEGETPTVTTTPGTPPPAAPPTLAPSGAAAASYLAALPAADDLLPIAPPVSVFVAASVIRAVATGPQQPPVAGTPPPAANPPPPAATNASVAPAVASEENPAHPNVALSEPSSTAVAQSAGRPAVDSALSAKLAPPQPLEARLAALRAASPPPVPPPRPAPVPLTTARSTVPPPAPPPTIRPSGFVAPPLIRPSGTAASEPARITPGSPKPIGQGVASVNARFSTISPQAPVQGRTPIEHPIPIRTRGDSIVPDTTRAGPRAVIASSGAQAGRAATATTTVAKPVAPPVTAEAFRDPSVLLRALRVPVTQTNLASATLALQSPQRIPAALAALERALPDGRNDPRVATLRTIVGFVNRLDPQSPTLAAQIAAYVSHVVDGAEPKLATLLQSYAAHVELPAASPAAPSVDLPSSASNERAPAAGAAALPTAGAPAILAQSTPTLAAAQTLIAAAALDHDLKTTLQTLLVTSVAGTESSPAAAIQTALTALTGVQLDVANTLAQIPQQVTFTIPLPLVHPDAQARVTIDRKRHDDPTQAIDGDNFHIAFILTTKHLGTVTIDLRTVGRAVNVGVHTEAELAAQTFGGALARLKDRLESLRYNVTSIESGVAPRRTEPQPSASDRAIDLIEIASDPSEPASDVDKIA